MTAFCSRTTFAGLFIILAAALSALLVHTCP
jgi:hypothetical protein